MATIRFHTIKDCIKTKLYLRKMKNKAYVNEIVKCGVAGINALSAATPVDTGKTAASWGFEVQYVSTGVRLSWTNSNVIRDGTPIAIMLQYGHGTGTGGYVVGRDYINPAIESVFQDISATIRKAVSPA